MAISTSYSAFIPFTPLYTHVSLTQSAEYVTTWLLGPQLPSDPLLCELLPPRRLPCTNLNSNTSDDLLRHASILHADLSFPPSRPFYIVCARVYCSPLALLDRDISLDASRRASPQFGRSVSARPPQRSTFPCACVDSHEGLQAKGRKFPIVPLSRRHTTTLSLTPLCAQKRTCLVRTALSQQG